MSTASSTDPVSAAIPRPRGRGRATLVALALLVVSVVAVYHNSFEGPFIFDDDLAIVQNPDIHGFTSSLRESREVDTATAVGRPLLRMTLWANYAVGGLDVVGYHVFNLVLHLLVAFTLFALLRRLLESPAFRGRYGEVSSELAFAAVLLWAVHPLQTESVTYVVQRAEMLGALFYLLTLYGVLRSAEAQTRSGAIRWSVGAVLACLLGMSAKETLATAPLLALAMDRIVLSVSWGQLWRARRGLYGALAGTWIFQALLVASSSGRKGTVGFDLGVSWWEYALTQSYYLCRYLALTLWPQALTLDYGTYLAKTPGEIVPYAVGVLLLLGLTGWALWRIPALGFCGLWFFLILAPTSSVVPVVSQTGAEHRMYLPLAGLLAVVVVGGYTAASRWWPSRRALQAVLAVVALLTLILGARTLGRNEEYRTKVSLWQTVVDRWPDNPRAWDYLGTALGDAGRFEEAIAHFEHALSLRPLYSELFNNFGIVLHKAGRRDEAIDQYERALRMKPSSAQAHNNLGVTLAEKGRLAEAIAHYEQALRLRPDYVEAHKNLGIDLGKTGRPEEGIAHFEYILLLQPDSAEAQNNLGVALMGGGRAAEAIPRYQEALRLQPDYPEAHNNLGIALASLGRMQDARLEYEQALRIKPDYPDAHSNLANLLVPAGQPQDAISHYQEALRLEPNLAVAHQGMGVALASLGRTVDAVEAFERALRLQPESAEAHYDLGNALDNAGRKREAEARYLSALELRPDFAKACNNLAWLYATDPDVHYRNGPEALRLAQHAVELTQGKEANFLDTLAVAYAGAGLHAEAVTTARRAVEVARAGGQSALASQIEARNADARGAD